jgi:uncharacterized membrane protein YgcG
MPMKVRAQEKSYTIDKLNTTAKITEKGDVEVQEEITYTFNGSYNGVYRNLNKNKTNGYIVSKIAIKDKSDNIIPLSLSNDSKDNTYEIIDSDENTQIKVFSKSIDEKKTLIINYTIQAAALKYKEFGQLYWNFYKVENNMPIKEVNFNLSLKDSRFELSKFKYWVYIDGESNTNYDSNSIHMKANNLTSLLGIKIRFQPEFLKIDEKSYDDSINENMKEVTPKTNVKENKKNDKEDFGFVFAVVVLGLFIYALIYFRSKNSKKFKEALEKYRGEFQFFEEEILNTIPTDLSPALVNLLYNEKHISSAAIPSTLFYLCKKGYYTLEKSKNLKSEDLNETEEVDLCFIKNNVISPPPSYHLRYFIEWLSNYEKNGHFSLKSIGEEVNSRSGTLEFKKCFSAWENLIKEEGQKLNFYTILEGKKVLSNETYNEKIKWLAYRQYILNYFNADEQSITSSNSEDILIYASALEIEEGELEKFSRKLNNLYNDSEDPYYYDMYNDYSYYLTNLYLWDTIDNNIYNTTTIDNNNSSGDGGFGGFSGGSDCSGGGGGDSGAF